jgi:hypothetical protein
VTWQAHGKCMTVIWLVYVRFMDNTLLACDRCMSCACEFHGWVETKNIMFVLFLFYYGYEIDIGRLYICQEE